MTAASLAHHRARIERVARQLRAELDAPLALSALARSAGFSARQFERVFARLIGETPRAMLRRLRLERAARRLRTSKASILHLGLEAGYESHAAFTRAFRGRFGHTPAAWRGLTSDGLQPRDREQFWQLAFAGGLRSYLEAV